MDVPVRLECIVARSFAQSASVSAAEFGAAAERLIARKPSDRPTPGFTQLDSFDSPVGRLLAAADEHAVCLLQFLDPDRLDAQLAGAAKRFGGAVEIGTNPWLDALRLQLAEYFEGKRRCFDVPLAYSGSTFQQKVWSTLCSIGYGQTWSYRQLAERVGDPAATRAVGAANGMNPIAIVIPCHRVVNATGELGGYGGGLWRKRVLLDLEKGQTSFVF